MDRIFTWDFWQKALVRAIHTFAQTAVSMIVLGTTFAEIDWANVASVAGVAAVISLLKSIAVGVPESDTMQITFIPENAGEDTNLFLNKESIEEIEEEAKKEGDE